MNNKRSTVISDLEKIHMFQDPVFSPDGRQLAFVRKKIDGENYVSHLFVQNLDSDTAGQWTFGSGTVATPKYSPDGKWIVFTGTRAPGEKNQLFLAATMGGEAERITNLPEGASMPRWKEDSTEILFSTPLSPGKDPFTKEEESDGPAPLVIENLKYKSDAAGFLTNKKKQLAVISVETRKITVLTEEAYDLEPAGWDREGNRILYLANKEEEIRIGSDVYMYDREKNTHTKLMEGSFSQASFSPDQKHIAAFGHELKFKGATQTQLWQYEVASGQAVCLTNETHLSFTDSMIGDIHAGMSDPGPHWKEDGRAVYALAGSRGSTNLYEITLDGKARAKTEGAHHVFTYAFHAASGLAAAAVSRPDDPGEIYTSFLENPDWKQLTTFHDSYRQEVQLLPAEEIWFKAEDGLDLQGWILRPETSNGKVPGLLEIHGGPHAMYGNTYFHEMQLLAAGGYAVFYCNPRGSHGYGQEFVDAVRGDYGGMDYKDIMAFTDEILNRFEEVDKDRLGVTGGSYGGFMTNWIVSHTDRFKAAATLRCISNWISFYGVSDIGYFFTEWELGKNLHEDPDLLWMHSPLRYVKQIHTPLLIMHGEKDYRCPIEQAEQLFVSLKHLGRTTRFVRFPEANHELSRSGPPALRRSRLQELTDWFEHYLLKT